MSAVPSKPTVLNPTAPSNFAYIDQMEPLETLPRVCTVPEVRSEPHAGTESYPYLQRALDSIGDAIPVIALGESVDEAATELETRLDPGVVQAFAVADIYDGALVTNDGPARALARDTEVSVTGSIGVLISAVDNNQISEAEADQCLKQWIDETDYRAPSRNLSEYR